MEQEILADNPSEIKNLSRKSWTAYVGLALISIIILIPICAACWSYSWKLGLVTTLAVLAYITYQVLLNRSYNLYYDDTGVWVYSGVFPWAKGVNGVLWRDLDGAVMFQTFFSWLFKSYSVRIGHRYTKTSEIFLTHINKGHDVVAEINVHHKKLISNGVLK